MYYELCNIRLQWVSIRENPVLALEIQKWTKQNPWPDKTYILVGWEGGWLKMGESDKEVTCIVKSAGDKTKKNTK